MGSVAFIEKLNIILSEWNVLAECVLFLKGANKKKTILNYTGNINVLTLSVHSRGALSNEIRT